MSTDSRTKYLKYKNKYLELKKHLKLKTNMTGGFNKEEGQLIRFGYSLYPGYILNKYTISTIPVPGITPLKCIYEFSEGSNIAFIPKITTSGIKQENIKSTLALILANKKQTTPLPVELLDQQILPVLSDTQDEINRNPNKYNYYLETQLELPRRISTNYMKELYIDGLVDLAFKVEDKYYVFNEEAFHNNQELWGKFGTIQSMRVKLNRQLAFTLYFVYNPEYTKLLSYYPPPPKKYIEYN
jgi:hypothetical protein